MPRYAIPFTKSNADNVRQLTEVVSDSFAQRQRLDFFTVGCVSTPADATFIYSVRRITVSSPSTGTAIIPTAIDPFDAVGRCTAKHIITADNASFNTSPLEVFRAPCHHRATYTFAAAAGEELVGANILGYGISLGMANPSTLLFEGTVMFKE